VLIYDGECGFCRRSLGWARWLGATCAAAPYQQLELTAFGLTEAAAAEAAWFVAPGRRWRGHEAVAMVLRSSRLAPVRGAGRLLGSPLSRPVASRVYDWVAANRSRLP
jgi:predicted DCC family thiol-disulfide oxidoreductase YuxK